jgi:hypothetical protein
LVGPEKDETKDFLLVLWFSRVSPLVTISIR